MMLRPTLLLSLFAVGCGTTDPAPTISSGAHALGIETFDIQQSTDHLLITGLDMDGTKVASVDLKVGSFVMALDEAPREVTGRQMTVDVLGKIALHESEGLSILKLPLRDV